MKVLRLPVDSDLSETSLQLAVDLLLGAADAASVLHLSVSPQQLFAAKRLVADIADRRPKSLLGILCRLAVVEALEGWSFEPMRWMLVGCDHIVYSGPG